MDNITITSVSVSASSKIWGGAAALSTGGSDETNISLTAEPRKEQWTILESREVVIKLRKEIQRLLILDSKARKTADPKGGMDAVIEYDKIIQCIQENQNGSRTD